jgi:hypothetical protein
MRSHPLSFTSLILAIAVRSPRSDRPLDKSVQNWATLYILPTFNISRVGGSKGVL